MIHLCRFGSKFKAFLFFLSFFFLHQKHLVSKQNEEAEQANTPQ